MKVLKVFRNIIIGILSIIFFGFAIAMTILMLNYNKYGLPQFGDKTVVIIKEEISSKNYKKNDVVIVESKKIEKFEVGQEIFALKVDKNRNVNLTLGIVGEIYTKEEAIALENGETYTMEFIVGSGIKKYESIGFYLSIFQSKWGFLFAILIPNFLIFIYQLYSLVVEIKYGEDEPVVPTGNYSL